MRKFFSIILLTLSSLTFLFSCKNNNDDLEKFSLYYSYKDSFKGIEIYCWEQEEKWYTGILPGTNRFKFPEEVSYLQDNLPCPIKTMKEILLTYSKKERKEAFVCIVSVPPREEELYHGNEFEYFSEELYFLVYSELGLIFSE